jgi:hypothetical protein
MTFPAEADALYDLPLEEFTPARNELVRQLRRDGHRDEAAQVAELRKPSLSAWVVNRLARDRRDDVDALLRAADELRAGRDDAVDRFRRSHEALVRAGRDVLSSAGRTPSDAVLQEVATTLRAAAAAEPEPLVEGRLTRARETSGFAALGGAPSRPAAGRRRRRSPDRPAADGALEKARRELSELRAAARDLRREAAAAEREARSAQKTLDDAVRRADQAEEGVAHAERRLASLRPRRGS